MRARHLLGVVVTIASCKCGGGPTAAVDAGPPPRIAVTRTPSAEESANPVLATQARIPPRRGACAQVRSVPDEQQASGIAEAIRQKLTLPVELLRADLGDKGIWFRICVGDEESAARLSAKAAQWTAPGGELEPFLDEPQGGTPRFFVKERETAEARAPSREAALALLSTQLAAQSPLFLIGGPAGDALALAGTADSADGGGVLVAATAGGASLLIGGHAIPGCVSCELALKAGVVSQRAIGAGDLLSSAGDELLIEELSAGGERVLSVLALAGTTAQPALDRRGGLLIGKTGGDVLLDGEARSVEADEDSQREVLVTTTELRTRGDAGCALERRAAIYDATDAGLTRLDVLAPQAAAPAADAGPADDANGQRTIAAVLALDAAGDHDLASRACAAQASAAQGGAATRHCIDRVRTLLAEGKPLVATNAGGMLAAAAPSVRAALATPFFNAASVLDVDPRLLAAEPDCTTSPLVKDIGTRSAAENIRLAAARQAERLSIGDIADAVFVAALRDFGADTPVGGIASRWLDRLQTALPARHAAIEALLLPPVPSPPPGPPPGPGTPAPDGAPGFGGSP